MPIIVEVPGIGPTQFDDASQAETYFKTNAAAPAAKPHPFPELQAMTSQVMGETPATPPSSLFGKIAKPISDEGMNYGPGGASGPSLMSWLSTLGNVSEAWQGGTKGLLTGQGFTEGAKETLDKGGITGNEWISELTGLDIDAQNRKNMEAAFGPKWGPRAYNVSTMGGLVTPGNVMEVANDPLNLIGLPALKAAPKAASKIGSKLPVVEGIAADLAAPGAGLESLVKTPVASLGDEGLQAARAVPELDPIAQPAVQMPVTQEPIPDDYFRTFGPKFKPVEGGVTGAGEGLTGTKEFMKNVKGWAQRQSSTLTTLRKMGPVGVRAADSIENMTMAGKAMAGDYTQRVIPIIDQVPPDQIRNIAMAIEKPGSMAGTPFEKLGSKLKAVFDDIDQKLAANVENYKGLENYYPHRANPEFIKNLKKSDAVRQQYKAWLKENHPGWEAAAYDDVTRMLADTGDLETVGQRVRAFMTGGEKSAAKFGNVTKQRLNLLPPEAILYDKPSLINYFERASDEIARSKFLGANYEKLDAALPEIQNLADRQYLKEYIDILRKEGKPLQGVDKLEAQSRALNAFLLKFTTSITNLGGRANLLAVKGMKLQDWVKSLASAYTKEGKAFAAGTGLTGDLSRELAEKAGTSGQSGLSKLAGTHMKVIGMKLTEGGNRTAATNAGKNIAQRAFSMLKSKPSDKFWRSALSEAGIDPDITLKRGYLTKQDLQAAAYYVTSRTQGMYRSADVPKWWNANALTKSMKGLASASQVQAQVTWNLFKNVIADPQHMAINGLMFLAAMEGLDQLKYAADTVVKGSKYEPSIGKGLVKGPGLGIASDMMQSISGGTGWLGKGLLGPSIGGAVDVAGNAGQGKWMQAMKPLLSRIPFAGSTVTPRLYEAAKKDSGGSGKKPIHGKGKLKRKKLH